MLLSFKRASEELNLSASTLSHLIRSLEERLETRLLNRTTRSVSLTSAGQNFYVKLQPIFSSLGDAIASIQESDREPHGKIKITSGDIAAAIFLKRLDPKFHERFPRVNIEILAENKMVDLFADGFDAGIRLYKSLPKDMIAIALTDNFRFVAVASPSYLRRFGTPANPKDLQDHSCVQIRFNNGKIGAWEFEKNRKKIKVDVAGYLTTNNPNVMIEAAITGRAIAYIAEPLIENEIKIGKLIVVLEKFSPPNPGVYLYFPRNRHMTTGLRAVVDSLKRK